MGNDKREFDDRRFLELLDGANFLGAWILLKESHLERTDEAIQVGLLANRLVAATSRARQDDEREQLAFNRALLTYILRDWPGLASLYREQLKPALPGFVPDNLAEIWQEFADVMGGRKTVDESFRQRMDEARGKAREYGVDLDPLQEFAREAEKELRKGAQDLGDFLKNIFQASRPNGTSPSDDPDTGKESPGSKAAGHEAPKDDGPAIKVKIQDADDPLPKDIHQASPAENDK